MSKVPDQTTALLHRIAGQYIPDRGQAELAVEDVASFLAAFGAFVDFQGINTPSGFRALGNFFLMWKDNRATVQKRALAESGKTHASLEELDEQLDAPVVCAKCEEEKPKVETRTHGKRIICFSCRPLFAVPTTKRAEG